MPISLIASWWRESRAFVAAGIDGSKIRQAHFAGEEMSVMGGRYGAGLKCARSAAPYPSAINPLAQIDPALDA
jgi:hypothetical protein